MMFLYILMITLYGHYLLISPKNMFAVRNALLELTHLLVKITLLYLLQTLFQCSVLTIPIHDFPFSNLADDCLTDELNPENNAVNEININNQPT